jgi:hypothetical protein
MGRPALIALSLCAMTGAARAETDAASDTERYTLRAELGFEYDTNAHHTEIVAGAIDNPPIVASPLERFVLAGTLSDVVTDGQTITLGATAAGKIFDAAAARDENVAIAQSSLAWQAALGATTTLTFAGAYYEAFQGAPANLVDASERRNFRSLAPTLQLGWGVTARTDLMVIGGYRTFVFKPDRDDDFNAPTAALELRWTRQPAEGEADWEVSAGAGYEHRAFGGPALMVGCAGLPPQVACAGPDLRVDDFLLAHLDLTRVGRVLVGVGYAFHDNSSNSYGDSVLRHFITAKFAAGLPGGLTVAARGELLLAHYPQPPPIGEQLSAGNTFSSIEAIEDENRSSVRVDLSRDLGDRLRMIARYTFYANELASASPIYYRRQTLLLSLVGTLEK